MGSGINGNVIVLISIGAKLGPLPLWEVELMETPSCNQVYPPSINWVPLPLWEVELMETFLLIKLSVLFRLSKPLPLWEVELMETVVVF